MREYIPATESLRKRIEILLAEAINDVKPGYIDIFIGSTTDQLMELFYLETRYGKRFR